MIIKYQQSEYEAKITELEGYHKQLTGHLDTMEKLKDKMPDIWNDARAQETMKILSEQVRQVRAAMDKTAETLTFYRTAVEKLNAANSQVDSLLEAALSVLVAVI